MFVICYKYVILLVSYQLDQIIFHLGLFLIYLLGIVANKNPDAEPVVGGLV